jgi:hypothetical protein
MEFLKLDEDSKEPLSGWEEFFTGAGRGQSDKSQPPRRGFYNYYPVKGAKPNATVVATFSDPRARLNDGKEHPYLVTMPYGSGKVVFLGSGELWRLRQYREIYHERFWTKLARYAGSGNLTKQNQHGIIVMGKTFTANHFVRVEARLFNRDMQPLDPRTRLKVEIKPPSGVSMQQPTFEMQAKPGQEKEATGWFTGRFLVTAAGNNYEIKLQVPGTADILSKKFDVKPSDPEMDNTMPDFGQMRQLASKATDNVLTRVTDNEVRNRIKQVLERTNKLPTHDTVEDKDAGLRLYFDRNTADIIPECMITDRKTHRNRGPVRDIWDEGVIVRDGDPPWKLSYTLLIAVGLLSVEWLTRKLLKLA